MYNFWIMAAPFCFFMLYALFFGERRGKFRAIVFLSFISIFMGLTGDAFLGEVRWSAQGVISIVVNGLLAWAIYIWAFWGHDPEKYR